MILMEKEDSSKTIISRFLIVFLDSLLVLLLVGLYVFLNISGSNNRLKLMKLEKTKQELEKRKKELEVNIEYMSSPEHLDSIAKQRFGMEPVTGDKIFVLRFQTEEAITQQRR